VPCAGSVALPVAQTHAHRLKPPVTRWRVCLFRTAEFTKAKPPSFPGGFVVDWVSVSRSGGFGIAHSRGSGKTSRSDFESAASAIPPLRLTQASYRLVTLVQTHRPAALHSPLPDRMANLEHLRGQFHAPPGPTVAKGGSAVWDCVAVRCRRERTVKALGTSRLSHRSAQDHLATGPCDARKSATLRRRKLTLTHERCGARHGCRRARGACGRSDLAGRATRPPCQSLHEWTNPAKRMHPTKAGCALGSCLSRENRASMKIWWTRGRSARANPSRLRYSTA
jgi:hypothetical protein